MNELMERFNFEQTAVRAVEKDGEPWFVAKDVCDILGHTNVSIALQMLDDDEKDIVTRESDPKRSLGSLGGEGREGGAQKLTIVSESGLYALIMRSNKPEAKAFRRWVTHEMLPAIRKTGGYRVPLSDRRALTDGINRRVDEFFARSNPRMKEMDRKFAQGWKDLALEWAEEAGREKWEALGKLAVVKEAYNDLLGDDFAANKLIEREERRWRIPKRKAYLG